LAHIVIFLMTVRVIVIFLENGTRPQPPTSLADSQLQTRWHKIWRWFLKRFQPEFSTWDLRLILRHNVVPMMHLMSVRKSHMFYTGCEKVGHIVYRVSESRTHFQTMSRVGIHLWKFRFSLHLHTTFCIQGVRKSRILYVGCQKVAHILAW